MNDTSMPPPFYDSDDDIDIDALVKELDYCRSIVKEYRDDTIIYLLGLFLMLCIMFFSIFNMVWMWREKQQMREKIQNETSDDILFHL